MRWWVVALAACTLQGATFHRIQFAADAHPAVRSAATLLARTLGIPAGAEAGNLRLVVDSRAAAHDGYRVTFSTGESGAVDD
jgi:hypothetical protein